MADTHSVAEKMRLSEPTTKKISMKIDRGQKCRAMTLVSGSLGEYSQRFPGERASNNSGVVENDNFQRFCWLFFGYFRDEASVIIWRYAVRRRLFSRDARV